MSERDFNIRTRLTDESGLNKLKQSLSDIESQAKRITSEMAKWGSGGMAGSMASGGGFAPSGVAGVAGGTYTVPRKKTSGGGGSGQNYNLDTQQGLMDWTENVYAPIAEMMKGFMGGSKIAHTTIASSHHTQVTQMSRGGGVATQSAARTPTPEQMNTWMAGIDTKSLSPQQKVDYNRALLDSTLYSGSGIAPSVQEFFSTHGAQLGAPSGIPAAGGAGGAGGGGISHMAELGYGLGSLAKKNIPFLTVAGATMFAGSQVMQGYGMWQQSSAPIDQLAHSLGTTAKDVETFRRQVVSAGAAFGIAGQQSAQMAASLTQAVGNIGQAGIVNLTRQTAAFSYNSGLSPTQATQLNSLGATLGITSGVGSSMSNSTYDNMLNNMVTQGGMAGRQGQAMTEYAALASQIGNLNPTVSNPQGLAGMVAAMSASGIQGLQGARGQQVASQFISGMASPNGFAQNLSFSAIMQASHNHVTNPLQIMELMQAGPTTKIPGTNITVGQAIMGQIKSQTNNPYQQAAMMVSAGLSPSLSYAQSLLKVKNPFSTTVSTQNSQQTWASTYDLNKITAAQYQAGQASAGSLVSFGATAFHGLGFGGGMLASFAAAKYAPKMLGGAARGIGGIMSRFGIGGAGTAAAGDAAAGAGAGAAADVGALGAAGGIEAAGAAADATGIGLPVGLLLGAVGLGVGGYGLWKAHQHAVATATHNAQVANSSGASARFPSRISNLTIDNLHINSLHMPTSGGAASMFSGMGNVYAPSSNASQTSSGGSWFSNATSWLLNQVGLGGSSGGSASKLTGNSTDSKVFNFLKRKGLTTSAAAGIMGNLQQESSMSPTSGVLSPGTGYGLAQWTTAGRQAGLEAYAKSHHSSVSSLGTQLGYLWQELKSGNYGSVSAMNKMSPSQAAVYFQNNFEMPLASAADTSHRTGWADQFASMMQKAMENALSNHAAKYPMNVHIGAINP